MPDIDEIYADVMVKFSVSRDGKIAKLVLASERPGVDGKTTIVPVTILTMPTSAMEDAVGKIANVLQTMKSAKDSAKN